jgi:tetratricopeptide (TPR) repeat protein
MSLHFLGDAYRDAGAYQQAIETYFELQAVADRSGNFNASRSATSGLETVYLELGYTQGAIDIYTQTLADAQQRGDRYSEIALRQLGNIYQERGEYEQALARYQEELAVLEAIGDPYGRRQYPLANIGQMYLTLGQPQAAISAYQQALAAAQTNENPVSLEIEYAFTQLAEAYLASGDIEAAIATYQQSVDFAISTWGESTDATAEALLRLANAYQEFEQWSAAISAYQQIVSIGQALASDYWQLEGLIELGIIYEAVGDAQQSHEALNQSLERITQASDRNLQVDSLIRISAVYDDLNDPQQASRVLSQAIDTVYSSPPGTIALNVDALANQLIASGDSARAIDFYQQVLTLNRDEKYRVGLMRQLAEIYKSNQQFQAALEIYQQVLVLSRERRYCQIWCMARN